MAATLDLFQLPFCQRCSLCEERTHVVRGIGPSGGLMIVGEAPGRDEDLSGKPFVGAAGHVLDQLLSKANLTRDQVYLSNAIKCRPPNNAQPLPQHIKTCHDWLQLELDTGMPSAIILLGAVALKSMGITTKISVCHGTLFDHNGYKVVPMYHPAAALHNPALRSTLESDWVKLQSLIAARTPTWAESLPKSQAVHYQIHQSMVSIPIAWDTETRSLEDKTLVCLSWAASPARNGVVFPGGVSPFWLREGEFQTLVGHNMKYDLQVLRVNQMPHFSYEYLEDTAILAYLLREPSMGLKDLVLRHFGVKLPDAGDLLQEVDDAQIVSIVKETGTTPPAKLPVKTWHKILSDVHPAKAWRRRKSLPLLPEPTMDMIPRAKLQEYALNDAGWTLALWYKLRPMLLRELEPLYAIEMKLVPILSDMEMRGVEIDVDATVGLKQRFEGELDILQSTLGNFGIKNPRSTTQKAALLETQLKMLAPAKLTKGGKLSVGRKQLERLPKDSLVTSLLEYSELEKLRQFCEELLRFQKDSVIHTNYNQVVTETGRLSSSKPNLQNIPVRTEQGKLLRKLFVPRDGCVFVSADMSQIELRILAHYSQDPTMLRAYAEGRNLHLETMFTLWPELRGLSKPDEHILYKAAKNTNFCKVYGGGPAKIAETAGILLAQAEEVSRLYDQKFPAIRQYQNTQHRFALVHGYVETLYHRRRYCPDITSSDRERRSAAEREAANMPIQGTAADILKEAMVEIAQELPKDSHMLLQVHDEVIVECSEPRVEQVSLVLKRAMEQQRGLSVPIKVDISVGKNWGELT